MKVVAIPAAVESVEPPKPPENRLAKAALAAEWAAAVAVGFIGVATVCVLAFAPCGWPLWQHFERFARVMHDSWRVLLIVLFPFLYRAWVVLVPRIAVVGGGLVQLHPTPKNDERSP